MKRGSDTCGDGRARVEGRGQTRPQCEVAGFGMRNLHAPCDLLMKEDYHAHDLAVFNSPLVLGFGSSRARGHDSKRRMTESMTRFHDHPSTISHQLP